MNRFTLLFHFDLKTYACQIFKWPWSNPEYEYVPIEGIQGHNKGTNTMILSKLLIKVYQELLPAVVPGEEVLHDFELHEMHCLDLRR